MKIKVGINSPMIKDFGGEIDAREVEIIELGLDRVDFLDKQNEKELLLKTAHLASSFGTEFTIHAPHIDSRIEGINLENLFDRDGGNKIGVFPGEISHIIEMVGSEHLKMNLDIGHAFIASNAYGLSLEDYFELGDWIHQMHLHDNFGVLGSEEAMFGDRHLPLGLGKIDFRKVFKNILKTNTRNLILEVKNSTAEYTLKSITQIREFCSLKSGLMTPEITYSIEPAIVSLE